MTGVWKATIKRCGWNGTEKEVTVAADDFDHAIAVIRSLAYRTHRWTKDNLMFLALVRTSALDA